MTVNTIRDYICGMNIGQRIREKREVLGLTQPGLANLCGWQSQARLSHYETGRREPSVSDLMLIAKALRVNIEWLITGNDTTLSEDETHLLHDYRDNPEINKDAIRTIARSGRSTKNPENSTNLLTEQKIA